MVASPQAFTPVQRRMVEVGEHTGALSAIFVRVAEHEEQQVRLERKVGGALHTPALVFLLCLGLATFLPPFLFEGLFQLLRDSKVELPWPTVFLLGFSEVVRSPALILLLGLPVGLAAALAYSYQSNWKLRILAGELLLRTPVLGRVVRMLAVTRFAHALETLVRVGTPLVGALDLAARSAANEVLQTRMQLAVRQVREGVVLRRALADVDFFPQAFLQGIETGQESGQMGKMVGSLRQLYEIELDHSFEVFTRAVEPIFLVLVGGLVGFTVMATVLPMLRLVEHL
jgi:type II secretory pathway component PulF